MYQLQKHFAWSFQGPEKLHVDRDCTIAFSYVVVHTVLATNFKFLSCQLYASTFSPQPPSCTRRSIIPVLMLPLSFNFWSQFQLMLQGMGGGRKKSTFLTKTLSDEYSYRGERFPPKTFSLFTHSPNALRLIMPLGHCMQKKDYN